MSGWWRDFGAARFGRPASPRPIVRSGLLARLDRAFGLSGSDRPGPWDGKPPAGEPITLPVRESSTLPTGESTRPPVGGSSTLPVVVVIAGSGAGKSTLLAQWAEHRHVVMVDSHAEGGVPVVDEVPAGAVVVLDGLERLPVDGQGWRRVVELVGVVPLVLSGREAVPVSAVDRLGAGHLAFAEDETYQVLAAALADAAGADGLAPDLHLLTGGWPALVGLAAAWLARLPVAERGASLRQLARVDGPLQDHLVGVLVGALHHDEREFIRRLAHLPAIDAATADALDLTEDLGGLPPIVLPVFGSGGRYGIPEPLRKTIQQRLPLAEHERQALLAAFQGM